MPPSCICALTWVPRWGLCQRREATHHQREPGHSHVHLCVHLCVHVLMRAHMCACVHVYVCICVYPRVRVSLCACVCVHACTCVSTCMSVCACEYMPCAHMYPCVHVCTCMSVCACAHTCICMCMCVYVGTCVCVCTLHGLLLHTLPAGLHWRSPEAHLGTNPSPQPSPFSGKSHRFGWICHSVPCPKSSILHVARGSVGHPEMSSPGHSSSHPQPCSSPNAQTQSHSSFSLCIEMLCKIS